MIAIASQLEARLRKSELVVGFVVGSSTEGSPAPASQITYTVLVMTSRVAPFSVSGVIPENTRLPDDIDTIPAKAGSLCTGICENGTIRLTITETFDYTTDCT